MKKFLTFLSAVLLAVSVFAQKTPARFYELRIYHTENGRMNALIKRFADHTTKLFEKHGMTNEGYWLATADSNKLLYILSYPSRAARDSSWKAFLSDPEWRKVSTESEKNGKILSKIESVFMEETDFSNKVGKRKANTAQNQPRVFELRTYYCYPDRLPALLTRFRKHTTKLFKKHGMTNIAYWTTIEDDGKNAKLVYILAHNSEAAARASFDAFTQDPKWIKVRDESEKTGKIVERVESVFMTSLPFSNIK